jgi:hypothetical protein
VQGMERCEPWRAGGGVSEREHQWGEWSEPIRDRREPAFDHAWRMCERCGAYDYRAELAPMPGERAVCWCAQ